MAAPISETIQPAIRIRAMDVFLMMIVVLASAVILPLSLVHVVVVIQMIQYVVRRPMRQRV
jgi:hypothetical protein